MAPSSDSAVAKVPKMEGMDLTGRELATAPPGLGSLPYSLAVLLFWFKKTKAGNVAWKGGEGGQATPWVAEGKQ